MLISQDSALDYLAARGLLAPGTRATVEPLGGGVSCIVLGVVAASGERYVIKQALSRLRVADEWLAKRERAMTEANALRLVASITPGAVPRVFDADPEAAALTIERAPAGWRDWKSDLLAGHVDPSVGFRLGALLAEWHAVSATDLETLSRFDEVEAFEQLRIEPYHRTVAAREPGLRSAIERRISELLDQRRCLVHGDFSPKNVLVGSDDGDLWILDWEVAHLGAPVFDLAFMLSHLFLKALHLPSAAPPLELCSASLLRGYESRQSGVPVAELPDLLGHVGCLILARVDGKSPAEYLDEQRREDARRLGRFFLLDPPDSLEAAWAKLGGKSAHEHEHKLGRRAAKLLGGSVKLASFSDGFGRVEGDSLIPMGTDFLTYLRSGSVVERGEVRLSDVGLRAPVPAPGTIVGVGLNYRDHASEAGLAIPSEPPLFTKHAGAVIGHGGTIEVPSLVKQPDYEAELAVVIGRRARAVARDEALEFVAGYTCANDISARDLQFSSSQWFRGKAIDSFLPLGPWLVTADEIPNPNDLEIGLRVNGKQRQQSSTNQMIWSIAELLEFITRTMTLEPGDVVLTGTPSGVGMATGEYLRDGDVVAVEIAGIGTLENRVRYQPDRGR